MIGVIGEPEPKKSLLESFGSALLECALEVWEAIPLAVVVFAFVAGICLVGTMVYYLMFDPNAVDVASRLDALSIDPKKWIARS